MITSFLETLSYKLAHRRIGKREIVSLPNDLSQRQLLLAMPSRESLIEAALALIHQIELPPDQIELIWIEGGKPSDPAVERYRTRILRSKEFDWFGLPSGTVCDEIFAPRPHVAIDLNTKFVLPAAYVIGRAPALFRVGVHHPEAEPFRDILFRYEGDEREAYFALRRILYNIEPALLPMQPMSTRVFY